MTDKELIAQLRNSKGWPTLGNAAADRIELLATTNEQLVAINEDLTAKNNEIYDVFVFWRAEADKLREQLLAAEAKLAVTRPAWKNCAKCRIMGWR